ncbi:hypothetical protein NP493_146g00015 [Ridgeia piscesae]|uniref:Small ribosomal subunit protein mS40 n=1 Tax=Ridgeia piscesae TaxID=27915 RepID=A0AAD9P4J0_RIDPI|nr:hypothetical protein NP493_146g00015 [Ridgeia piscesae]
MSWLQLVACPVFAERRQWLSLSNVRHQEAEAAEDDQEEGGEDEEKKANLRPVIDPRDNFVNAVWFVHIRVLGVIAYELTYRGVPVWVPYRRNFKGRRLPEKTRKTCINVDLLNQFISPETGEVISYTKTGLCQMQHKKLLIAVAQAYDQGTIEMPVPFRQYDYSQYYPTAKEQTKSKTQQQ